MEKIKQTHDYIAEGKTLADLTPEENAKRREADKIPSYLLEKDLLEIINAEFDKFIVDEVETRKALFICGCGSFVKNLSSTFNLMISGESSAGKSWIAKNVLKIFPENVFSKETYRTKISPNALTYWHNSETEPDWDWNGKILYLEDIGNNILNCDVFKIMISEGSTATIVGKKKGKNSELPATFDIEINGKPITFITTAIGTPIEEIKNRFLLIDLDESAEQTEKIMRKQTQEAISGKKEEYNEGLKEALTHLKRVEVLIPNWVEKLINYIPRKEILRWRREFPRFIELIKCSTALHQYQREKDLKGKIIANEQDYEIARKIIGKISSASGSEGLTRREKVAYESIKSYYKQFKKGCSRNEIYAYKPIYSDRQWDTILNKLCEKGLLHIKLELSEETNRKSNHYYPIEFGDLSLPDFKILMEQMEQTTGTTYNINMKTKAEPTSEVNSTFTESVVAKNVVISSICSSEEKSSDLKPIPEKKEVRDLDIEYSNPFEDE